MGSFHPFRSGDWVEARPVADVLATLDHQASLEELLFMPEMVQYCGHRFQVGRQYHTGDSLNGDTRSCRMAGTFNLETYCDGSGHGGCKGRCLLLWKAAWLNAADGPATNAMTPCGVATADAGRLEAAARLPTQNGKATRYRCQFTESMSDTTVLPGTSLLHDLADVAAHHMVLPKFMRHAFGDTARAISAARARAAGVCQTKPAPELACTDRNDLQPGEVVQVRPVDEIMATLDKNGQKNGLAFETEMLWDCNGAYPVAAHIKRILDGKTGEMIRLPDGFIILERSRRTSLDPDTRRFGRLSPYFYWHETWLRRVENPGSEGRTATTRDVSVQPIDAVQRFDVEVCYDPSFVTSLWEELEQEGTAFQARAWLLPLYRIVAPKFDATPLFVTVYDRSSGRPMMLIPLCIRRKWGLVVIEFADFGVTDYNAPLVSPALTLSAAQAQELWDDICHSLPPADIVLFDKVPETITGRTVPLAQFRWVRRMDMRAWAVALPKTREEYDSLILKPKDRKEQRRKRRNLVECLGNVMLVHAATESEGHEIFQALRQQRQARYKETGYFDGLDDPTYLRFYEAVAFEEWGRIVALSALKAQDRTVATLYTLMHGNDYLLLMHCFESGSESLSPGIVAIDEMVTHLINAGTRSFDFTIGNEGYKRQFGVKALVLYDGVYPLSSKGWLFVQAEDAKRRIKSALYPGLTACRQLVQERSRLISKRNWGLAGVFHPNGPVSKQSTAAKPENQQPVPRDAGPDHARGKARPKPVYTH